MLENFPVSLREYHDIVEFDYGELPLDGGQ